MRLKFFFPLLVIGSFLLGSRLFSHSIVFVHIGSHLPHHLYQTIAQARYFNQNCPIFVIASRVAFQHNKSLLEELEVECIPCETLVPSQKHIAFMQNPEQDMSFCGLWVYSSERFFYLQELIEQYHLTDVFHLESDVLLYADLKQLLPVFQKRYVNMLGMVFENDKRCVPSILYVPNAVPMNALIDFYPQTVSMLHADMDILADFKDRYYQQFVDFLPITCMEYGQDHLLEANGVISSTPTLYSTNMEEFGTVFDGAAFGIYLAGWDSRWHPASSSSSGVVSQYSVINPSYFDFTWGTDKQGRKIPFIAYAEKNMPLVNLHVTNKSKIGQFLSMDLQHGYYSNALKKILILD